MQHCQYHSMSFNVSLLLLTVTLLSCSLQLPLLDLSLSLSLSLPLPLDEPVLMDAKEDKDLATTEYTHRVQIPAVGINLPCK